MEKTVSCNLESWFMLNETIGKSSSMNDNVRRILQNNKDFRQHFGLCGNDDFFSLVIDNMKDLEKEVFNNVRQFSGGELNSTRSNHESY